MNPGHSTNPYSFNKIYKMDKYICGDLISHIKLMKTGPRRNLHFNILSKTSSQLH